MNLELNSFLDRIEDQMIAYEDSPSRIHHFTKVRAFAARIGREEGLSEREQFILEAASILHDIGIKPALLYYGSSAGKYQEFEGPGAAGEMLSKMGLDEDYIDRICWLIGHHHTFTDIESADHQILVEADAIVNAVEERWTPLQIDAFLENVVKTNQGRAYLERERDLLLEKQAEENGKEE